MSLKAEKPIIGGRVAVLFFWAFSELQALGRTANPQLPNIQRQRELLRKITIWLFKVYRDAWHAEANRMILEVA